MDSLHDYYQPYSWHQSHDQATVILLVPYETLEDDVSVVIERNYLIAGVRGQNPIVKGQLYGNVDTTNSMWQLEPRALRLSGPARERTISTTSTASTQSSYALVSDPDISSSFAASLEHGLLSDIDDPAASSPALSSPISSYIDEHNGFPLFPLPHHGRSIASYPASPPTHAPPFSLTSSYSSVESLHVASGRLLTLHLEKADSVIWPSLVVGPVPEGLSPSLLSCYPWASASSQTVESRFNMDPTSLVLIALELYDIRQLYEDAFEYFVRAWHQARVPSATIRLATHYLPAQSASSFSTAGTDNLEVPNFEASPPTPTPTISETSFASPAPGTPEYYLDRIGGPSGLAQLFLSAGVLHLEGSATPLLSSAYAGLSSLRSSLTISGSTGRGYDTGGSPAGAEGWRRDRECARRYFERARALLPSLDVPLLPPDTDSDPGSGAESGDRRSPASGSASHSDTRAREEQKLEMPSITIGEDPLSSSRQPRRRRRKGSRDLSSSFMDNHRATEDDDRTWYLYIPGLVGAGTALLVVGFLSFSSWRKSQGSS
ncbi:uncharacterized protein FIBRA_06482 [Fibroporia radiculosa]|uniref:CS domain-containing protein n=1 Tax=Fibroporia radiculosa TaxID=599839 RepID=J4IBA3_9APHY|nr:uncharacterized protein FIBRA_06482 [Fibroporia radiculosa]CCM04311.1 predicted protein [Fibroporia radiculosa]